jgi:thioredoxin reductase
MRTHDVVVIGGGAAGLSAALVLARARRTVAVIDAGQPRNAPAPRMNGFLSRDGMPPQELLEAGRGEISGYGGQILDGRVLRVRRMHSGLQIVLEDHEPLTARRVLVATGLHDELPDIPGVRDRWGRDLLHCPYCHGYEVGDQPLGVLGGSLEAVQHAQLVRQWSPDVVLFSHTDTLTADAREQLVARAIGIVDKRVERLVVRDDQLVGVELESGQFVPRTAVFVRPRFVPHTDVLADLGCRVDGQGWIVTDAVGRTSQPGIWAAGNVVNPRAQVITAAGEGSATAVALNADLVDEDVYNAVREFHGGLNVRGDSRP